MGGGYNYAKEYAKYRPESTKFGSYVDEHADLSDAWKKIEDDPNHPDSQYWIKRGATSKDAFGRAHAAEDFALRTGDYHGGASGRTDYMPGTDAWETLFPGDDPSTRFEGWRTGATGDGNGNGDTGGWASATGGGAPGSANYPIGLVDYEEPSAMSGIPLDFQPWLQPDHIPDSLWNYQAPTLNEWEVDRNWDWAQKPASEYLTDEQKAAKDAAVVAQIRGDREVYDTRGLTEAERVAMAKSIAAKGGWTPGSATRAMQNAAEIALGGGFDFSAADMFSEEGPED